MRPADEFATQLTAFIVADVAPNEGEINGDTDLLLTGLVDSLGVVMISDWIENELSIVIDPVDVVLENFQTVDSMVTYARSRGALTES